MPKARHQLRIGHRHHLHAIDLLQDGASPTLSHKELERVGAPHEVGQWQARIVAHRVSPATIWGSRFCVVDFGGSAWRSSAPRMLNAKADTVDQATPHAKIKPRLAIVSTYDDLCGIAGYTRRLEQQLSNSLDVVVFDLDQFLLRHENSKVQSLGDNHIKEIASQLKNFDFVNIQLEYGTLGLRPSRMLRRLNWILAAAPAVSVTFHTILDHLIPPWTEAVSAFRRMQVISGLRLTLGGIRNRRLSKAVYGSLRHAAQNKPVRLIAHNRRDARLLRDLHRFSEVFDHPLSFVSAGEAERIRESAHRTNFATIRHLPDDAKLIGTFGFLSDYKGFETAVRALRLLPANHHLLVFGAVHPQAIRRHQAIDPYLSRLMDEGRVGRSILDVLLDKAPEALRSPGDQQALFQRPPDDMTDRIHFMGALNDEGFAAAMAICDAVVMPYLEVGQTSSGAIALALDMGCRVIASRNRAFLALDRYFPNEIEFFDIGNHAELAQHLASPAPFDRRGRRLAYNTETNTRMYLRANSFSETKLETAKN
jgi:glycosyltransferase involved in cell wall biosynthesis